MGATTRVQRNCELNVKHADYTFDVIKPTIDNRNYLNLTLSIPVDETLRWITLGVNATIEWTVKV